MEDIYAFIFMDKGSSGKRAYWIEFPWDSVIIGIGLSWMMECGVGFLGTYLL